MNDAKTVLDSNANPDTLRVRAYIIRYQMYDEESAADLEAHADAWEQMEVKMKTLEAIREEAERIRNEAHYMGDIYGYDLMRTVLAAAGEERTTSSA